MQQSFFPPEEGQRYTIADVRSVFDHWVQTCRANKPGPRPVLSDKRERLIRKALSDYGTETVTQAISGVALSDWHQGHNPRGKTYDDIELVLRDAKHIEMFATLTIEAAEEEDWYPSLKAVE